MKMPFRLYLLELLAVALMAGTLALAPQVQAQTEMQPQQQEAPCG